MKMEATTAEMLATCCTHIAIADNISSMGLATKVVNVTQKIPKKTQCGKLHAPGWQHCPAKHSTCNYYHKIRKSNAESLRRQLQALRDLKTPSTNLTNVWEERRKLMK